MNSIRLFLTISIISIIILANFLAALQGYQESMQEAEILFDHKLEIFSEFLAINTPTSPQVNLTQNNSVQQSDDGLLGPEDNSQKSVVYQVRDQNNQVIFQSKLFDLENSDNDFNFDLNEGNSYLNYANFRWRSITRYYAANQRWVFVMEKQDVRYKLAESVILKSVYPIILAVPTIALIIFFIIRRGLRPVIQLADSVDKKRASNLSSIEIDDVPEELSLLTQRINDLLFRLDSTLLREKRFASDAAHELRTPIAALNIQMKNLMDEGENGHQSIAELSLGVKRMSHLVEQILTLNRSSPEFYANQFKPVDLSLLIKELVVELYSIVEEKEHDIEMDISNEYYEGTAAKGLNSHQDYTILAEEFALQTLFKNLIVNAVKYTPNHGQIRVRLEQDKEHVMVTVMDSGPGIVKNERERIFERFYRLDGDRNQSKVLGCGLGLAIVKQIASLHKATIEVAASNFKSSSGKNITAGLSIKIIFTKKDSTNSQQVL